MFLCKIYTALLFFFSAFLNFLLLLSPYSNDYNPDWPNSQTKISISISSPLVKNYKLSKK
jgi:hypothetical protein